MRSAFIATLLGLLTVVSIAKAQNWETSSPSSAIPLDAIVGGQESNGTPLYICHGGENEGYGLEPGKFRPGLGGCDFGFKGKEITVPDFDLLVATWENDSGGNVPANAIAGGCEPPTPGRIGCGATLYYCRTRIPGVSGLIPGNVRPGLGGCHLSYGGKEYVETSYGVLVSPSPSIPLELVGASNGAVPLGAIRGGTDVNGQALSLCVGSYLNGEYPGKIRTGLGGCYIPYYGAEVEATVYQVLAPNWMTWADATNKAQPLYDFPTGVESNGTELYTCRAYFQGGIHPGSQPRNSGNCTIGWGNQEQKQTTEYDILTDWEPFIP